MVGDLTVCYLFPRQHDVRANDQLIDNGNRIEWSPIRSVIIRVINKIGWQRGGSPICRWRVWLQTELGDTNSCYQLKITASISGKKRLTLRTNISGRDNVQSKKNFSVLEIPQFFDGCWYGYCDQFCDWWIWLSGLTMIGCFNCPITGVRLQPTSRLQLFKMISEK